MKRKRRDNIDKTNIKMEVPLLRLDQYGTADDVCFGKHHDPRAEECKRCGDCEICLIVMGQLNNLKRIEVEAQGSFKDLEEVKIKPDVDKKTIRKSVKNRIRGMIKMGGGEYINEELIVDDIFASYSKDGFRRDKILKLIKLITENSNHIIVHPKKPNELKWKFTK